MPPITETTPGVFNWVDLTSPDVDAAVDFYTSLFGWDAVEQHDDDGNRVYVMFELDGATVAGVGGQMESMDGAPAIWNSYVATDDAEATMGRVEEAGGEVLLEPMDVFDSGRMGVLRAPDGTMLSVWEPRDHIGAEVANEPNAWFWSELLTRELSEVRPFYAEVFDWSYQEQDMGEMGMEGTYLMAAVDDRPMAGLMSMPDDVPPQAPNHWAVYFQVADVDATVAAARELGGSVVREPWDIGVGIAALLHDPQGGSFSVMQPHEHDGQDEPQAG